MKSFLLFISIFFCFVGKTHSQSVEEKFQLLPLGAIKPEGWLKTQMEQDMQGFVGHLDSLVPTLIYDPIYSSGRIHKNSKSADLGNLKSGDAGGDEQYKWWNSETQSNWWDGYIRYAILLNDSAALIKVKNYITTILNTQDADGYIGIYDDKLRYNFKSENGELWSKTTLYRGILAYYEYTNDSVVWNALVKAVDNVISNYPINKSHPFYAGKGFSGGVAHGLTFTDVLDRMYALTLNQKYRDYALFLYRDFCENYTSEKDVQLSSILNPEYRLQSHGVHTYEHIRPLLVAAYAGGDKQLIEALNIYINRVKSATTIAGGPIGDEWVGGRKADAVIGYEYCSIHELMASYIDLLQKTGLNEYGNAVENIFYNAGMGSRHPEKSCIAYLKTDNSYQMDGTKNGEAEPGRNQTRYKYSPVHQDVAVCCTPNAGRISPYFVSAAWMKEGETILVATLLMPNTVETKIGNANVHIQTITEYPYTNTLQYQITVSEAIPFTLKIRKPDWVNSIITDDYYEMQDDYIVISRVFYGTSKINITFSADVIVMEDSQKEFYFTYGPLIYALPFTGKESTGKKYAAGFTDYYYTSDKNIIYKYIPGSAPVYKNGTIQVNLQNPETGLSELVTLLPIGKTILRQAAFK